MKGRGNPGRCSESPGRVSAENSAKRGLPFFRDLRYSGRRGLRRSRVVENNGERRTPPWTMHGHVRQRMHTRCTSNPLAGRGSTCVAIRATSATGCGTGAGRRTVSQLDARQVSPVWSIAASSPVTLVRGETHPQRERVAVADIFSLWRLAGRKSLRVQVRYLIRRARALMEGEYRALIAAGPTGSRCGREAGHGSRSASHDR